MILLSLCAFLPMALLVLASFTSNEALVRDGYSFFPREWSTEAYSYIFSSSGTVLRAYMLSFIVTALGTALSVILTVALAYPLSKTKHQFHARQFYVWFFFITMLFGGGLIPYYMTISKVGLVDSFWALILPGAVPVYNVIILLNFFRNLPGEIEEAARVDGASYLRVLFQIIVPLSLPAIATLTLFCTVNHWNSWFEGLLLMNDPTHYPLQSYLQTVIVNRDMSLMSTTDILTLSEVSDRTSKAAQTFVAAVPMLVIYPFFQKYFTAGITLGGVKG